MCKSRLFLQQCSRKTVIEKAGNFKKTDHKSLLTTGTKTVDPNKFKEESCQSDGFAEFMQYCSLFSIVYNIYKACRSHDSV